MNVSADLHRLLDRALDDDPRIALTASRELGVQIDGWVTDRAVLAARRTGRDWAKIGRLLGMSRQAARQRFGRLDGHRQDHGDDRRPVAELPSPDRTPTDAERGNRQTLSYLANERRRRDLAEWEGSGTGIVPW